MPRAERPIVPEAGQTKRRPGLVILTVFLAAVGSVPTFQFVWELVTGGPLQQLDIFRRTPTLSNIKRYEDELADSSVVAEGARPGTQWAQLLLAGQGNEKVVIGLDGWLFYRTDVSYPAGPAFGTVYAVGGAEIKSPDPLAAILDFRRQLSERGIELVIVPVPVKPQIYPEKLSRFYDASLGPPRNLREEEFFDELARRGVAVINLARVLWESKARDGPLYMPLDTHWTPLGMRIFADALAKELKGRYPYLARPARAFKTRRLRVRNQGDIHDMLGLPAWSKIYEAKTITVEQVLDAETGRPVETDPDSPIVLLGDSFANVFSVGAMKWGEGAGLGERLALRLGRALDVIAVNGGAPTVTRRMLARRGGVEGKKLVVWEFATRELADPNSEWELVRLPEARARAAEGPITVKAEVTLASKPPVPGEDPYKHCVTFTKYRVLSVEKGRYDDDELIVAQWVMRDFKLLPSAEFRVGDVHHLVLVPYRDDLHPDLRQAKRADDTEDYEHQLHWVVEMK